MSVLLGDNTVPGTFAAKVDYTTGATPTGLAIGDLDDDGDQDIAVVNEGPDTVSVFLGVGNGTFLAKVDYATALNPSAVAIGDVDDDGDKDLAVANQSSASVSVLLGDNTFRHFRGQGRLHDRRCARTTWQLGDVDNDGDLDLATVNQNTNTSASC